MGSRFLLIVSALVSFNTAATAIYKCTDKNGAIIISNFPCHMASSSEVYILPSPKITNKLATPKTKTKANRHDRKRKASGHKKKQPKPITKQQRKNNLIRCASYKDKIKGVKLKLQTGYTLKQHPGLMQRMAHNKQMQQKYNC